MNKRNGNVGRDERNRFALREAGWSVLTVWECQTRDLGALQSSLEPLFVATHSDQMST